MQDIDKRHGHYVCNRYESETAVWFAVSNRSSRGGFMHLLADLVFLWNYRSDMYVGELFIANGVRTVGE